MNTVIAAVGARTPVGCNAAQSAAAVRADIANFNEHPSWVDHRGEPMALAAALAMPRSREDTAERLLHLLDAALADLESNLPQSLGPLPMVVALPANRPELHPDSAHRIATALIARRTRRLDPVRCESLTAGRAGGLAALIRSVQLVAQGNPLVIAAAADSWLHIETLEWLDYHGRLHSPAMPWGFTPGEAGGACLVADEQGLEQLGLPGLGVIEAVGTGSEPHPLGSETPCIGAGLTAALQATLDGIPEHGIEAIYCDLNGERHRADEMGFALTRISQSLRDPDAVFTPATCWGDVGAAGGILFAALATAAHQRGYAQWQRALLCSSSDGPERAALLLAAPPTPTSP